MSAHTEQSQAAYAREERRNQDIAKHGAAVYIPAKHWACSADGEPNRRRGVFALAPEQ